MFDKMSTPGREAAFRCPVVPVNKQSPICSSDSKQIKQTYKSRQMQNFVGVDNKYACFSQAFIAHKNYKALTRGRTDHFRNISADREGLAGTSSLIFSHGAVTRFS